MSFLQLKEQEPFSEGPFHPDLQEWVDSPRVGEGDVEGVLNDVRRLFALLQFNFFRLADDNVKIEFKQRTIYFLDALDHLNFSTLSGDGLGLSLKVMALLYTKYPELRGHVYLFCGGEPQFFDHGHVVVVLSPDATYDPGNDVFVPDEEILQNPRFWIIDPALKIITNDLVSTGYNVSPMQELGFRLLLLQPHSRDQLMLPLQLTSSNNVFGPVVVALTSHEEVVYVMWRPEEPNVFRCDDFDVCVDPGKSRRSGPAKPINIASGDLFVELFPDDPLLVDFLNRLYIRLEVLETRRAVSGAGEF